VEGGCDVEEAEGAEGEEKYSGMLMRDVQGTAAEKLALFGNLKAASGFANASAAELCKVENMLWTFAATEKGSG
jgi:hypothetical protein